MYQRTFPLFFVDGIGVALRFKTKSAMLTVAAVALLQKIAAVKLQTGAVGVASDAYACFGTVRQRSKPAAKAKIVVVTLRNKQLTVALCQIPPYCFGTGEIKRRATHLSLFPCRNKIFIHGQKMLSVYLHHVVQNVAVALAVEIEIDVTCRVEKRQAVAQRKVIYYKSIFPYSVFYAVSKICGIVFLAVGGKPHKLYTVGAYFCLVRLFVETAVATVQMIFAVVVFGKKVFFALQTETAVCNAVGAPAHKSAEIGGIVLQLCNIFDAQCHVYEITLSVGNTQRKQCGAK